ncbi:probable sporulation protein, polysaccharide deacetylase family [Melghirimyces thermohalophilus]|uniref:Probable sporulation protein, polysaccharide deacetylase family n=1 Tax=Melghirimyces thermohalophilus TaxID=1236220 RepID=A0A1G6J168_9BACL|nr:probable sporulation protein, polysaccharide deacetylase family [Melghirimyces thermohalophilus]
MKWLILSFLLLVSAVYSPPVTAYVDSVKQGTAEPVIQPLFEEEHIKDVIEKGARARYEPPVDARVDPIWKAIPGYNGRKVDQEATYRRALRKQGGEIPWVYREVPPRVTLDQLGAQPIYRGNEQKPMAALMVNVAWGTEHLPGMLNILEQEGVPATFFLDGSWVKKHPEEAKMLLEKGYEVGNHAYSHPLMSQISRDRMQRELQKTEELIRELGGRSRFFAPPAGDFNQSVVKEAYRMGMKTVLWTVDTVDWRPSSSPQWMTERVRTNIDKGSLLLMHPTPRTVQALPQIIRTIEQKGLRLGTVGEVLSSKRIDPVEPFHTF